MYQEVTYDVNDKRYVGDVVSPIGLQSRVVNTPLYVRHLSWLSPDTHLDRPMSYPCRPHLFASRIFFPAGHNRQQRLPLCIRELESAVRSQQTSPKKEAPACTDKRKSVASSETVQNFPPPVNFTTYSTVVGTNGQ